MSGASVAALYTKRERDVDLYALCGFFCVSAADFMDVIFSDEYREGEDIAGYLRRHLSAPIPISDKALVAIMMKFGSVGTDVMTIHELANLTREQVDDWSAMPAAGAAARALRVESAQ